MAKTYIPVDREQPFLLPPDLRDWLPAGHLVWFVLDAVAALDTSAFHRNRRLGGVGRRAYDPDMLLALLIYSYANGERSSRRIERLCQVDVACRVVCANLTPDHTAVARFRAEHDGAFKALFAQVVGLCVAEGMGGLGTLAIDGTKIGADASRLSNRTREVIRAEIERVVGEAEQTDAREDALWGEDRGDELSERLADPTGRVERLRRAMGEMEADTEAALDKTGAPERVAKAKAKLAQARAEARAKVDAYDQAIAAGRQPGRNKPVDVEDYYEVRRARQRLAKAEQAHAAWVGKAQRTDRGHQRRANTTDPDSRMMRSQGAWVQGYNAHGAFTADGLAVAARVTNAVSDAALLHPIINQVQALFTQLDRSGPDIVLADAGYWSEDNITAYDETAPDEPSPPDLVIPPRDFNPRRDPDGELRPPPADDASPAEKMRYRLSTPEGKTLYGQRAAQAEGPFGHLKAGLKFRRFSRRGHTAVDAEWHFVLAVRNLLKLNSHRLAQAAS